MKIAVIGAGWTGLVTAYGLSDSASELTVFEKENQPGGLATFHDYGGFFWDRFYHVILPMDRALIDFLGEIGLGEKLRWERTLTGVYVDRKFHSVSSTLEFLRFPPLHFFQKIRLGLTIVLGAAVKDWRHLEKITVEDWLVKYSGRTVYEKFWKPLLLAKLGESYRRVSAVFIWTYIKRLFAAREGSSAQQEKMGYLEGGYKTALDALTQRLTERNSNLRFGTSVERIEPAPGGGIWLTADGQKMHFDKVIFTGPTNVLERTAAASLVDISEKIKPVEYLGVVCMVLVLRKQLTPFYVLNIADSEVPFTGVIGMNTLVDTQQTGGHRLVYLPKYVLSTDPMLRKSDAEIKAMFFAGLKKMYPEFSEEDVVSVHVNRAFKVQPLQVLNYSEIIPKVTTRHPDFFVLNTSQFVNDTLNNDSVTRHVNQFLKNWKANAKIPDSLEVSAP